MNPEIIDKALSALHNARGLPALERNVTSILQSISSGGADDRQLVGHVVEDAALTHKVLKLANSPMYAPFAEETASVSSALQILGNDGLMHVALGTRMLSDNELAEDPSLSQTLFASELARTATPDRIEEASVATLMVDLGRLVLTRYLPEEAARIDQQVASGSEADVATRSILGMSLEAFGSAIAQRWNLPTGLVAIIEGSGDPTLVNIARMSTRVSALLHEGNADAAHDLLATHPLPGIDKERLAGLVQRKREAIESRQSPLDHQASTSSSTGSLINASTTQPLLDLLEFLRGDNRKTVDEMAGALIPVLGRILNTAHCLLFMATKSGDFCVRYGFGKGIDELRSKLRVPAEFKPTAFHAAIKNNVDVSITDALKLKPSSLPEGYQQLLPRVSRFLVMPIANSSVSGLLYCDWENAGELKPDEMAALRKLRDLFLPFFPR